MTIHDDGFVPENVAGRIGSAALQIPAAEADKQVKREDNLLLSVVLIGTHKAY